MKKLLILLIIIPFLTLGSSYGAEEAKPEVKYELTITVTYNSLNVEDTNKIIVDALTRYGDACKTSVRASRNTSRNNNCTSTANIVDWVIAK